MKTLLLVAGLAWVMSRGKKPSVAKPPSSEKNPGTEAPSGPPDVIRTVKGPMNPWGNEVVNDQANRVRFFEGWSIRGLRRV